MALGVKVKELRDMRGWKQVTLAKNAGIPQGTISRIESGRVTQPRMGQLQKLAEALGTTIDYLAGDSIQNSPWRKCPLYNGTCSALGGIYDQTGKCPGWSLFLTVEMCCRCQGIGNLKDRP